MVSASSLASSPFSFGLRVGVGLDRLVNVLAVIEADHPLLEFLEGVGGGVAQGGVGAGFLDQRKPVGREAELKAEVVQRADGVVERDLAGGQPADAVQRGVPAAMVFVSVCRISLVVVSNDGTLMTELNLAARF